MSPTRGLAGVVAAEGGPVTFARFMELALTHPVFGYYTRAGHVLGRGGDFNTAPALSPFFNRTLARLVAELVDAALAAGEAEAASGTRLSVVELGGGEGQFAAALLAHWQEESPGLRDRMAYRILEVGPGLQQRQAEALGGLTAAGWDVGWGATLEEACAGTRPVVMVGNEFVDTVPPHVVRVTDGGLEEAYVRAIVSGGLEQVWGTLSTAAALELEVMFGAAEPRRLRPLTVDGVVEVFPGLGSLMERVAAVMPSGSLVNIDYGEWFPGVTGAGDEWGLRDRAPRRHTVRGYFKQQLEPDPLVRPGEQDLTADVDFAALDLHGRRQGFETVLFTTLSAFLRAGSAETELCALGACSAGADPLEADREATVLRNLLDERDLGGAFKVMVQVREHGGAFSRACAVL